MLLFSVIGIKAQTNTYYYESYKVTTLHDGKVLKDDNNGRGFYHFYTFIGNRCYHSDSRGNNEGWPCDVYIFQGKENGNLFYRGYRDFEAKRDYLLVAPDYSVVNEFQPIYGESDRVRIWERKELPKQNYQLYR